MDTSTSYLGLRLPHPFIAGASPLGCHLDSIKRLEDAGCAAVVLHSLFEEQISLAREGHVSHASPPPTAQPSAGVRPTARWMSLLGAAFLMATSASGL